MSEPYPWPQAQNFEEALKLKAAVDGNEDNYYRWFYRCVRIGCATVLALELLWLVLT